MSRHYKLYNKNKIDLKNYKKIIILKTTFYTT